MAASGQVQVGIKIDAGKTTAAFREARRGINAKLRDGLKDAGERVVLPTARSRAPVKSGALRSSLIVRATPRKAFLTTSLRGQKGSYVGVQEFGGTLRFEIKPKKKKALLVNGRPVARVKRPRRIKGRHFMTGAVESKVGQITEVMQAEMMKVFDSLGRG